MAQLRDSTIDGNLEVTGYTLLKTNGKGIHGVHPETGEKNSMLSMNSSGNTLVGYGGYINKNGNSHICGNEIFHFVASADVSYRPYYRAGDTINFAGSDGTAAARVTGYVTGDKVVFTIPLTKPIIGSPTVTVASGLGFIMRQGGKFTHGSDSGSYTKPIGYTAIVNNSGVVITAVFTDTTNAINNDIISIYWNGKIILS